MKKIKFGKWFSNKQNRKNFNEEIGRQFGVKVITNKKDFIWKIFAFIGILALISFVVSLTSSLVTGQDLWQGILDININHIFSFSNETWQKVGELINGSLR
jgi:bacteriorhodopsin